ncbi:Ger(x)C family spore germination protein [Mesobacillus foraminis]|uniref:Ger(x)C family spore germination protein n=1 Tax=Mesobacillus foraminis TaxID=279826 RepID=UPI001BE5B6BA|nr:Ger(x)C family spore germination protein [Mesobacillus foraminis]MBT2758231.1 Ger(x)C family spore germination protein [Mesobacillus foraminis]
MKPLFKVLLLVPFLFLLAGCWDLKEIEQKAYVIGIGLDKGKEEGTLEISYLIGNPEVGSQQSGGSSMEQPSELITINVADYISARNIANSVIAREISYDLLRVILVSEELASDKDFLRFIYGTVKDREIKRSTQLVVTKEKVGDYLKKNKPKMETRPHKYYEYMIDRGIETGIIPDSELHIFFRVTEEDAKLFLSAYTTADAAREEKQGPAQDEFYAGELEVKGETNRTEFFGSAVFLEGRMIGKLNGEENRLAMMLNEFSDISDIITTFPDPFHDKYQLSARLIPQQEKKIKMDLNKKHPKIRVTLPLKVEILSDPSMTNYAGKKKETDQLEEYIESTIEEKIANLVERTQTEFKAEPFGWSLYARKEFKTLKEYMAFDWMKTYPEIDIAVKVEVDFNEFGRQPKIPGFKGVRD